MKLLHIDSSILGDQSVSRELTGAIVARWRASVPGLEVVTHDLARDPLPHLSGATLAGQDEIEASRGEAALREFLDADVIVIGAPMYNFSIPSSLKAWIDRIAVRGRTFRYTETGPEGLAGGKRVIVVASAGGVHAGQPTDFVEPYLRHMFAFLGVEAVEFIRADGIGLSPEHRAAAIERAHGALPEPLRRAA
ncbi:FMN-dependent NADH-azoreductase [Luteimonas kalidii]|uniref:FMN dependent NADH:quinone oxidoreductase n=1 Tax=Luteimonas kalidii TaxID=3042025 RepID=A0ABT6JSJ9_9GAMM|nr:NAD(P)H-dependent oxidoreductase [Luteimonas kalidii]MDH5833658.1 NAD(P)H-dependent oxidoreductase [Luteimonas kalidii]